MFILSKGAFGTRVLRDQHTGKKFVLNTSVKGLTMKSTHDGVVFFMNKKAITSPVKLLEIEYGDNLVCKDINNEYIKINPSNGNITPKYVTDISSKFSIEMGYLITKTGEVFKYHQKTLGHFKTDYEINTTNPIRLSESKASHDVYVVKRGKENQSTYAVMDESGEFLTPFVFDNGSIKISLSPDWLVDSKERALLGFQQGNKNILTYAGMVVDELSPEVDYTYLSEKKDRNIVICGYDKNTQKSIISTYAPRADLGLDFQSPLFVKVGEVGYDGRIERIVKQDINSFKKWMIVERTVDNSARQGIIDEQGNVILPIEYDYIIPGEQNEVRMKKGDESFYFDLHNETITSETERINEMKLAYQQQIELEQKQQKEKLEREAAFEKWLDETIEVDMTDIEKAEDVMNRVIVKMTRREYLKMLEKEYEKNHQKNEHSIWEQHYTRYDTPRARMYREFLKALNNENKQEENQSNGDQPGNE